MPHLSVHYARSQLPICYHIQVSFTCSPRHRFLHKSRNSAQEYQKSSLEQLTLVIKKRGNKGAQKLRTKYSKTLKARDLHQESGASSWERVLLGSENLDGHDGRSTRTDHWFRIRADPIPRHVWKLIVWRFCCVQLFRGRNGSRWKAGPKSMCARLYMRFRRELNTFGLAFRLWPSRSRQRQSSRSISCRRGCLARTWLLWVWILYASWAGLALLSCPNQ